MKMEKKVFFKKTSALRELSREELITFSGGNSWADFWRAVGRLWGKTLPCYENYDHEAQLEALSNYGAPY